MRTVLLGPLIPNPRRMETGGGREQALARDEEFALGQVFEVRQDTCSWVRTQDQRDSEKRGAPGVWVGGLDLGVVQEWNLWEQQGRSWEREGEHEEEEEQESRSGCYGLWKSHLEPSWQSFWRTYYYYFFLLWILFGPWNPFLHRCAQVGSLEHSQSQGGALTPDRIPKRSHPSWSPRIGQPAVLQAAGQQFVSLAPQLPPHQIRCF